MHFSCKKRGGKNSKKCFPSGYNIVENIIFTDTSGKTQSCRFFALSDSNEFPSLRCAPFRAGWLTVLCIPIYYILFFHHNVELAEEDLYF